MKIVPVSRRVIEIALKKFDSAWRGSTEYLGWETNKTYLYAIAHDGLLYPPKKIISLATSIPLTEIHGDAPANSYLVERGFSIIPTRSIVKKVIPNFTIGKLYKRLQDIHLLYEGNRQSGISPSSATDAIFLFTGESGEQYGYKDGPQLDADGNGVYLYTGEGQLGDMQMTRGNLAISQHIQTGRALHLFHALGKSLPCRYVGEYLCAGHEVRRGGDREGKQRNIIVFHLVTVADAEKIEEFAYGESDPESQPESHMHHLADARTRAFAAFEATGLNSAHTVRNLYKRSRAVRDYVFLRAKGVCESCKRIASFCRKDGSPYLEPHHTTRVSDGGPDHPAHVGAICATCHREIHYGANGDAKNASLRAYLLTIEAGHVGQGVGSFVARTEAS